MFHIITFSSIISSKELNFTRPEKNQPVTLLITEQKNDRVLGSKGLLRLVGLDLQISKSLQF